MEQGATGASLDAEVDAVTLRNDVSRMSRYVLMLACGATQLSSSSVVGFFLKRFFLLIKLPP